MLVTPSVGEISLVQEVIDPDEAMNLGARILRLQRDHGQINLEPSFLEPLVNLGISNHGSRILAVGPTDRALITRAKDVFDAQFSCPEGQPAPDRVVDIFVGTPDKETWHYDTAKDYRLLVNLSALPLRLHVATNWSEDDYYVRRHKLYFREDGPAEHTTLEYGPGQGVFIDNMVDVKSKVPHRGEDIDGKVIMRLFATKEPDVGIAA